MDESLYDEFGNYIGPELSGSDEDEDDEVLDEAELDDMEAAANARTDLVMGEAGADEDEEEAEPDNAIVLHEDKKYYPTAEETYGPGTETLVMEEDAQPLEAGDALSPTVLRPRLRRSAQRYHTHT
ncbi:hypothetical protein WJX73_003118 [Symbiochloris irregularis]|uniref:116kDa U5 small nuclear ribonucleoprotein component N-terminal domain-containing protein n=1 Tax=Symbiochloris irregularis TaxID=706552 RepID=A0AAW1NS09_9CHLO